MEEQEMLRRVLWIGTAIAAAHAVPALTGDMQGRAAGEAANAALAAYDRTFAPPVK